MPNMSPVTEEFWLVHCISWTEIISPKSKKINTYIHYIYIYLGGVNMYGNYSICHELKWNILLFQDPDREACFPLGFLLPFGLIFIFTVIIQASLKE